MLLRKVSPDGRVSIGKAFAGKMVNITKNLDGSLSIRVATSRKTRKPKIVLPNKEVIRPL